MGEVRTIRLRTDDLFRALKALAAGGRESVLGRDPLPADARVVGFRADPGCGAVVLDVESDHWGPPDPADADAGLAPFRLRFSPRPPAPRGPDEVAFVRDADGRFHVAVLTGGEAENLNAEYDVPAEGRAAVCWPWRYAEEVSTPVVDLRRLPEIEAETRAAQAAPANAEV